MCFTLLLSAAPKHRTIRLTLRRRHGWLIPHQPYNLDYETAIDASPIKLNEWQKMVFEILGDEMAGTLNGVSLTGQHPLIASDRNQ